MLEPLMHSIKQVLYCDYELSWNQRLICIEIPVLGAFASVQHHLKAGLNGLVIIARVVPHVPIPNTTVKPLSADGTVS